MNRRDVLAERSAEPSSRKSLTGVEEFADQLIRHAARSAPPSLSERLEEEWLSDMAARPGPMSRLCLAIGCCWATRVIGLEHSAARATTASTAAAHRTVTMYGQQDSSLFSRRTSMLALIVCLHALVIYALATGLGAPLVKAIGPDTVAALLPNLPMRTPPLPPSPPKLVHEWVVPDEPQVPIEPPPDEHPGRDVLTGPPLPPVQPPTDPPVVNRILGGPGRGFPTTEDYYPPAARRLGEMGVTTVRVCVDVNGRLTAEPMVLQSSGSARLDEGAVRLARAGSGHYRATTENGRPMSSCYPFRIRFEFRD